MLFQLNLFPLTLIRLCDTLARIISFASNIPLEVKVEKTCNMLFLLLDLWKCWMNFIGYIYANGPDIFSQHNAAAFQTNGYEIIPRSVNFHFTRLCNYKCGFCFHTAKTSAMLPVTEIKLGFKMLKDQGMEKLNFSGGEPFLPKNGEFLGEMVKYCKETLKLPSVSIVSNGSLISENWFKKYGEYVDILAISCDSFDADTNKAIGRVQGSKNHISQLLKVRDWCSKYKVLFKINTVVNSYNCAEDMVEKILELNPIRWKVFQCLLIDGENVGSQALRDAEPFYIGDEIFQKFLQRHKSVECLVPESNKKMQNSYLILDEYMRFLDCRSGSKIPSKSILDVGVENALKFSGFDDVMFKRRGGIYKWSKSDQLLEW